MQTTEAVTEMEKASLWERLLAESEEINVNEIKQHKYSGKKLISKDIVLTLVETVGCEDGLALYTGVGFGDMVGLLL